MCIQLHSTPQPSPYPYASSYIQLPCPLPIHVHPATFSSPALSLSMCIHLHSTPQPSPYPCTSSNIQLPSPLPIHVHPTTFNSPALSLSLCIHLHSTSHARVYNPPFFRQRNLKSAEKLRQTGQFWGEIWTCTIWWSQEKLRLNRQIGGKSDTDTILNWTELNCRIGNSIVTPAQTNEQSGRYHVRRCLSFIPGTCCCFCFPVPDMAGWVTDTTTYKCLSGSRWITLQHSSDLST